MSNAEDILNEGIMIPFAIYNSKLTYKDRIVYIGYAKARFWKKRLVTIEEIKDQINMNRNPKVKGEIKKFTIKDVKQGLKNLEDAEIIGNTRKHGDFYHKDDVV